MKGFSRGTGPHIVGQLCRSVVTRQVARRVGQAGWDPQPWLVKLVAHKVVRKEGLSGVSTAPAAQCCIRLAFMGFQLVALVPPRINLTSPDCGL
jgi:hypothetical protein